MPPGGVVEAFNKAEAGHPCLDLRDEAVPLEQFAFEGGKEALSWSIVIGVPERTHRGPHAGFLAALAKSERGTLIGLMDRIARPAPVKGHVQGVQNQLGPQVVGHRPADETLRRQTSKTTAK